MHKHTTTWLAEGNQQHLDAFPLLTKDSFSRVKSNLQTSLDIAALSWSLLQTACSVAHLGIWEE